MIRDIDEPKVQFNISTSIRFEDVLKKVGMKRVYPDSDTLIATLEGLFNDASKLEQFLRNWKKAKLCHGCIYLHIGLKVSHNHCEANGIYKREAHKRIHGHYDPTAFLNTKECRCMERAGKLYVKKETS